MGRIIDTTKLSKVQKKEYDEAIKHISKTKRGKELVDNLTKSKVVFVVVINKGGKNDSYNPKKRMITWDSSNGLIVGSGDIQSPAIGLAHEMGHAEQHIKGELRKGIPLIDIENNNLKNTETPIAKELKEGIRKDYYDWKKEITTTGPTSIIEKI
jgi:hypothetical protein